MSESSVQFPYTTVPAIGYCATHCGHTWPFCALSDNYLDVSEYAPMFCTSYSDLY